MKILQYKHDPARACDRTQDVPERVEYVSSVADRPRLSVWRLGIYAFGALLVTVFYKIALSVRGQLSA